VPVPPPAVCLQKRKGIENSVRHLVGPLQSQIMVFNRGSVDVAARVPLPPSYRSPSAGSWANRFGGLGYRAGESSPELKEAKTLLYVRQDEIGEWCSWTVLRKPSREWPEATIALGANP